MGTDTGVPGHGGEEEQREEAQRGREWPSIRILSGPILEAGKAKLNLLDSRHRRFPGRGVCSVRIGHFEELLPDRQRLVVLGFTLGRRQEFLHGILSFRVIANSAGIAVHGLGRRFQVDGVPFFIVFGEITMSETQPREAFLGAFRKAVSIQCVTR